MRFFNALTLSAVAMAMVPAVCAAEDKPRGIEVIRDLPYTAGADAPSDRRKIDLYLPKDKKDFPILLFFHSGGFTKGDRKDVADMGEALARHGVALASAGYRLFPDVKHPDQVQDAALAFAWVKKHVGDHGGNGNNVFV